MPQQQPSASQFVLRPEQSTQTSEVETRGSSIGEVQHLKGTEGLLLFSFKEQGVDGRSNWTRLRSLMGKGLSVLPVFVDRQSRPHYPTGRITVRFTKPPSERQLEQFALDHRLASPTRNEYVHEQVTFEHGELDKTYLPDILDELSITEGVSSCWPETISEYKKL